MESNDKAAVGHSVYDEDWIESAWGGSAEEFINDAGKIIRPRIQRALDIAELSPGMHVLDIGCGRGEVVFYCARLGCQATGVDFSKEVISIANKAMRNLGSNITSLVTFILGDITKIQAEPESFDRIFLLDIVEHLHDWQLFSLYKTLYRLLKPDGYLVIHTLPNRWIFKSYGFIRLFLPWLKENPRGEFEKVFHVNEQSCVSLRKSLNECGFYCAVRAEQGFLAQAEWYKDTIFGDGRDKFYKLLRNPVVKLLVNLTSATPLRLFLTNDLYAVAAKSKKIISKCRFKMGHPEAIAFHFLK